MHWKPRPRSPSRPGSEEVYADIDGEGTTAGETYFPKRGLSRAAVGYTYSGDIEGTSTLVYLMGYRDGDDLVIGLERFEGSIGGQEGSCVLRHEAVHDATGVRGTVTVVPGMGTGGLERLSGEADAARSPGTARPATRSCCPTTSADRRSGVPPPGVLEELGHHGRVAVRQRDADRRAASCPTTSPRTTPATPRRRRGCPPRRASRAGARGPGTVAKIRRAVRNDGKPWWSRSVAPSRASAVLRTSSGLMPRPCQRTRARVSSRRGAHPGRRRAAGRGPSTGRAAPNQRVERAGRLAVGRDPDRRGAAAQRVGRVQRDDHVPAGGAAGGVHEPDGRGPRRPLSSCPCAGPDRPPAARPTRPPRGTRPPRTAGPVTRTCAADEPPGARAGHRGDRGRRQPARDRRRWTPAGRGRCALVALVQQQRDHPGRGLVEPGLRQPPVADGGHDPVAGRARVGRHQQHVLPGPQRAHGRPRRCRTGPRPPPSAASR